jgi:glycolate oxidase FAD binding subunit
MATSTILRPRDTADLVDAIAEAARLGTPLEIRGGGSKAAIGAPRAAALLDMTGFSGVIDYDPAELVLTLGAGTPLADVTALVESEGQILAFEPFDHGPIFGAPAGAATIGGVIAAAVAGSRRLAHGGTRDHLLGFAGVSGRGEHFVAGAKVIKNVTGYDLPKLATGSWGRLVAMTELTLKVLPRPRVRATRWIEGLNPTQAHAAMAMAMRASADVSAAAHRPDLMGGLTALRIEGFGPSVAARCGLIEATSSEFGPVEAPSDAEADSFWSEITTLAPLGPERPLWRINVPPSRGCSIVEAIEPLGASWLFDWAGGLVWAACDGDPARIRAAAEAAGGHAALVRGPEEVRAHVPALHPPGPGVGALEQRIRRAFDPAGIFETGRFLDTVDAD